MSLILLDTNNANTNQRRTYFNSVLIGYEDASVTFLGTFLRALAKEGKSFVVLGIKLAYRIHLQCRHEIDNHNEFIFFCTPEGDSLSYQTLLSVRCELYRERVEFQKQGDENIAFEGKGKFTFYFDDLKSSVDVYYRRLDNIRLSHQFSGLFDEINAILQAKPGGIVLLTNIGLNYNTMEEYQLDIPKYFRWLDDLTISSSHKVRWNNEYISRKLAPWVVLFCVFDVQIVSVWRETTASHWSYSSNGYYSGTAQPLHPVQ